MADAEGQRLRGVRENLCEAGWPDGGRRGKNGARRRVWGVWRSVKCPPMGEGSRARGHASGRGEAGRAETFLPNCSVHRKGWRVGRRETNQVRGSGRGGLT